MKSIGLLSSLCFAIGLLLLAVYFVVMIQTIIAPYLHVLVLAGIILVFMGLVFETKRISRKKEHF